MRRAHRHVTHLAALRRCTLRQLAVTNRAGGIVLDRGEADNDDDPKTASKIAIGSPC